MTARRTAGSEVQLDRPDPGEVAARPPVLCALTVVAPNLLPLVGVLAFHWQAVAILLLYWIESLVIGVITVKEIRRARGTQLPTSGWAMVSIDSTRAIDMDPSPPSVAVRFCGIYFPWILLLGLFVLVVGLAPHDGRSGPILDWWFLLAIGSLVLERWLAYRRDFLGGGGAERLSPLQVMVGALPRLFILQTSIIVGALLAAWLGAAPGVLVALVALKTGFELYPVFHAPRPQRPADAWLIGDDLNDVAAPRGMAEVLSAAEMGQYSGDLSLAPLPDESPRTQV